MGGARGEGVVIEGVVICEGVRSARWEGVIICEGEVLDGRE